MISKTQLQEGLSFKYKGSMFNLKTIIDEKGYYVSNFAGYVGNVDKIGTKSFTVYTYVMSKEVKIKINYSECEPVVEYFK